MHVCVRVHTAGEWEREGGASPGLRILEWLALAHQYLISYFLWTILKAHEFTVGALL